MAKCPKDGTTLLPDGTFVNADTDLKDGEQVGEYRVEGKLGQGGFGAVFKGVHPLIGKQAAIKVLNRQFSSNPQMVSRFIAEARAVNQIGHRNIIDIFSFGVLPDGRQYYVMELLAGTTLDKLVAEKGGLPIEESLLILRAVARALDAAHAKGIAHRDLKPENVFVARDDEDAPFPKLLDFGIAKLLGADEQKTHKTNTGVPMGTPYYMSPEQGRGVGVDHRTDYYAFGVMAFELITGRLPFDGDNYMDVLMRHMMEPPPKPSVVAGLPVGLDAPILQFLEKDPAKRPATIIEGLRALEDAARGVGVPVPMGRTSGMPTPTPPVIGGRRTPTPAAVNVGSLPTLAAGMENVPSDTLSQITDTSDPPKKRSFVPLAIGGVVVAAIAGLAVMKLSQREAPATPARVVKKDPQAGTVPPVRPDAAVVVKAPAVDAAAVAVAGGEVKIVVDGTPAGAEIVLDGKVLGIVPGVVSVPRGDTAITLEVRAKGFKPAELALRPMADGAQRVKLEKIKRQGKKGDGKGPGDDVGSFDD